MTKSFTMTGLSADTAHQKGAFAKALPFDFSGATRVSEAGEKRSDNIKSEHSGSREQGCSAQNGQWVV
jgi:hypothetical protein